MRLPSFEIPPCSVSKFCLQGLQVPLCFLPEIVCGLIKVMFFLGVRLAAALSYENPRNIMCSCLFLFDQRDPLLEQ